MKINLNEITRAINENYYPPAKGWKYEDVYVAFYIGNCYLG